MMNKLLQLIFYITLIILVTTTITHPLAQTWLKVDAIDSTDVLSISSHNDSLYAITSSRIFTSSDAGDTWHPVINQPAATTDFYTFFSDDSHIYLGTLGDGIFRSSDQGQSWQSFNSGLPQAAQSIVGITRLGDSLYTGTNSSGIYVMNLQNSGLWSAFNTGLFQSGVNSISTSGNYLVASVGYYLFVRGRTAAQWSSVNFDTSGIQRFVYETVPVGQYLFAGTEDGIYRGSPGIANWVKTDISSFPNRDIVALAAHGSRVIAGLSFNAQHWLFTSDNMGVSWDFRAHEFAQIWDLFVSGNRLWAGRSDGLWYIDMDFWTGLENSDPAIRGSYTLIQNYPNPFNPATNIGFQISRPGFVNLKVYNILGENVDVLLSTYLPSGSYEYRWDASGLPGGVYFYRLETAEAVLTKKMIFTP